MFLRCLNIRRNGPTTIELAHVVCGCTDAYFERVSRPRDFTVGMLLIREAGEKATDYSGKDPGVPVPSSTVASNGLISKELLLVLST